MSSSGLYLHLDWYYFYQYYVYLYVQQWAALAPGLCCWFCMFWRSLPGHIFLRFHEAWAVWDHKHPHKYHTCHPASAGAGNIMCTSIDQFQRLNKKLHTNFLMYVHICDIKIYNWRIFCLNKLHALNQEETEIIWMHLFKCKFSLPQRIKNQNHVHL